MFKDYDAFSPYYIFYKHNRYLCLIVVFLIKWFFPRHETATSGERINGKNSNSKQKLQDFITLPHTYHFLLKIAKVSRNNYNLL